MTLGERLDKLEAGLAAAGQGGMHLAKGAQAHSQVLEDIEKRVAKLEAQLAELDVMVLAVHAAIKDIQASI